MAEQRPYRSQFSAEQIIDGWENQVPRINPLTGNWETWDIATRKFVDTGIGAEGEVEGGVSDVRMDGESVVNPSGIANVNAIRYDADQELTDEQKATARANIGADEGGSVQDVQIGGVSVVTDKVANITTPFIGTVAGGKNLLNPRWLLNGSVDGETGKPINTDAYVITEFIEIKPNTSYTQWTEISTPYVYVYFYDSNFTYMSNRGGTNRQAYTFTTPSTAKYVRLLFGGTANPHQVSNGYKYQLEEGMTATEYEPFYESNLALTRKQNIVNLLNPTLATTTINGVTCTNNGDGTYTLNGTATANIFFILSANGYKALKEGVTYKLLGCPGGGSGNTYLIRPHSNSAQPYDEGNGCTFVYSSSNPPDFSIRIGSGVTCNNLVFKPMVTENLSATYDDFIDNDSVTSAVVGTTGLKIFRNGNVVGIYMNNASSNASSIIGTLPSDLATSDALILPYCGFVGSGATPIELYIAGGKNIAHGIYVRNGSTHSNLGSTTGINGYAMFVID